MDTCTDIIEEIISEEIVDETDQYEDNQSKRRAKRMTTAAVMRGCVLSLSYKQILIDGYIVASLRESVESNRQIRTPVSVRHCWECRLGFWKLVTSPQEGLDMEVSGLDHHAHNMQGAVQSIRRLCTCDRSRNSNRLSIFILCLGLYVRKDFLQASKSSVDADARSNSRSRVCGKEIIQHVLLFTLKPIKLAEVPKERQNVRINAPREQRDASRLLLVQAPAERQRGYTRSPASVPSLSNPMHRGKANES